MQELKRATCAVFKAAVIWIRASDQAEVITLMRLAEAGIDPEFSRGHVCGGLTVGPNALISQKWGIGRLLRMMRLYRSMFVPPSVWILITLLPSTSHVTKFGLSWSQWVSGTSKPGGAQSTLACQVPSAPKYKSVSLAESQIHTSEVEVEAEKTKILEL